MGGWLPLSVARCAALHHLPLPLPAHSATGRGGSELEISVLRGETEAQDGGLAGPGTLAPWSLCSKCSRRRHLGPGPKSPCPTPNTTTIPYFPPQPPQTGCFDDRRPVHKGRPEREEGAIINCHLRCLVIDGGHRHHRRLLGQALSKRHTRPKSLPPKSGGYE